MADSGHNEVVVERFIRATPQRVFAALTDAQELERWFFTEVQTDPRPGGSYAMWWRSEKEPERDHRRLGRYLEFVPGERLTFEWRGDGTGPKELTQIGETTVTITLKAEAGGTRLRLVHTGWADNEVARKSRESHRGGWTFYVENLERFLAGGPDERQRLIGQRLKST